mmetsp:Transcript_5936/g.12420  ORF Transcript_5936/g.12420 Transcript_5936/m.12420 type:complete len:350 (-) Transcript_5936:251-1300(-)
MAPLSPDASISSTENRPRAQRERRRLITDDKTVHARITDCSFNPSRSRERNREDKREGTKRAAYDETLPARIADSSSNPTEGGVSISLDYDGLSEAAAPFAWPPSRRSSSSTSEAPPRSICVSKGNFMRGTYDLELEKARARVQVFKLEVGEGSKLAGRHWRGIGAEARTALNRRAVYLIFLTPAGIVNKIPAGVSTCAFIQAALSSLSEEIEQVRRIFRNVLICAPKREVSLCVQSFGTKRVHISTQSFRTFSLSLLLQQTIFGPDLKKLREDEIVYRRKKTVVLHIRSACRLQDLFTVEDLCMVRILEGDLVYSLYPKLFSEIILSGTLRRMMTRRGRFGGYTCVPI